MWRPVENTSSEYKLRQFSTLSKIKAVGFVGLTCLEVDLRLKELRLRHILGCDAIVSLLTVPYKEGGSKN